MDLASAGEPVGVRVNAYADDNPRGFGLMQRDRNFDHYQDDGVFYDRRPSVWVEPKNGWGKGTIKLVEIPTVDETFDNIVAFWDPDQKPQPGSELNFGYRLHWGGRPPVARSLRPSVPREPESAESSVSPGSISRGASRSTSLAEISRCW